MSVHESEIRLARPAFRSFRPAWLSLLQDGSQYVGILSDLTTFVASRFGSNPIVVLRAKGLG